MNVQFALAAIRELTEIGRISPQKTHDGHFDWKQPSGELRTR
jgi:hypothetical protein